MTLNNNFAELLPDLFGMAFFMDINVKLGKNFVVPNHNIAGLSIRMLASHDDIFKHLYNDQHMS